MMIAAVVLMRLMMNELVSPKNDDGEQVQEKIITEDDLYFTTYNIA